MVNSTCTDLLILGTGLAGYQLAKQWRSLNPDKTLTMVTQGEGHFYSKPLLSTSLGAGKSPEELCMFDAPSMARQLQANIKTGTQAIALSSEAKTVTLSDNEVIRFDKALLALGAKPNALALQGDSADQVMRINQWEDYRQFSQRLCPDQPVLILGAGLVACEFANDLSASGHKVMVLAPDKWPLSKLLPKACSEYLQLALADQGVRWHLETTAVSVMKGAEGYIIKDSHGQTYHAHVILAATGLKPCVDLARDAGLLVERGICVDATGQTSHKDIYALGDCAEQDGQLRQYVAPIIHGAKALALTLSGHSTPIAYPIMPIVVKTSAMPTIIFYQGEVADWGIKEKNDQGIKAEGHNKDGDLCAVVLMGDKIAERQAVLQQLRSVGA